MEEHLVGCSQCAAELEQVRLANRLFASHIPTQDLADYGLGYEVSGVSREVLELHLADCATCREDVTLVQQDRGPSVTLETKPTNRWRGFALAASVALALSLVRPVWQANETITPRVNVPVLELIPKSYSTRGSDLSNELRASHDQPAILLLISDRAEEFSDIRLRVNDAEGESLWETQGLERSENGDFTVLLPPDVLSHGVLSFALDGLGLEGWTSIETYQLNVQTSLEKTSQ